MTRPIAPAASTLRRLAAVLAEDEGAYTDPRDRVPSRIKDLGLDDDEQWSEFPDHAESSIEALIEALRRGLTAQIGARLTRHLPHPVPNGPADEVMQPVIIEATEDSHPEEFDGEGDRDRVGWAALARAHGRECRWDFTPSGGTWLGWFEPTSFYGAGEVCWMHGNLVGFVRVQDKVITNVHVASTRRREGIARALSDEAVARYGTEGFGGPFTADGSAFMAAMEGRS
ncbi:MAG: hypothetical protein AB7Q42_04440 [Acidimicrobiia bacterium]